MSVDEGGGEILTVQWPSSSGKRAVINKSFDGSAKDSLYFLLV